MHLRRNVCCAVIRERAKRVPSGREYDGAQWKNGSMHFVQLHFEVEYAVGQVTDRAESASKWLKRLDSSASAAACLLCGWISMRFLQSCARFIEL